MNDWIDRAEALALLGVKPQTLYAYVSRGRIEARRETIGRRRSLYRAADVAELARRADASRKPSAIAEGSMAWGEASIVTHISTVEHGRLIYRGVDAVRFSASATLEDAACLLWKSDETLALSPLGEPGENPFAALAGLIPHCEASIGRGKDRLGRDSSTAISRIAAACGVPPGAKPVHLGLASAWSLGSDDTELLRRALVLLADHELNASTFAARVAASTGAPISACLLGGLSALSGPRHGGAAAALARMIGDVEREGADSAVLAWLDRDVSLPGFGHPLYPNGDIRMLALCDMFEPDALMKELAAKVREATGHLPNIDFALAAFVRKARLPANAPFGIFLLGRSVGWAAHAMEQALNGHLIRPRARYEGPAAETFISGYSTDPAAAHGDGAVAQMGDHVAVVADQQ